MTKFKVLSATKRNSSAWIVEAKGVNKTKAKRIAKKERGWWCGLSDGSPHKKHRKKVKGMDCYKTYVKIVKD